MSTNPKAANCNYFALSLILLLFSSRSSAQNFIGGDIILKRVAPFTASAFSATVEMFSMSSVATKTFVLMDWGDNSPLDTLKGSGFYIYPTTRYEFTGTHTYSSSGYHNVSVIDSFYMPNIVNIPNSGQQKVRLLAQHHTGQVHEMVSAIYPYDSLECDGGQYIFHHQEPEGDSLSFHIAGPGIAGYSQPPVILNPTTGLITFTGTSNGFYAITLEIKEWRKNTIGQYSIVAISHKELMLQRTGCPTAISDLTKAAHQLAVYPNPTSGLLFISDHPDTSGIYSLTDQLGQQMISGKVKAEKFQLNIESLPSGIYFLTVETAGLKSLTKVVKE